MTADATSDSKYISDSSEYDEELLDASLLIPSGDYETAPLKIYDRPFGIENIPNEFNAVTISLEANLKADLNWQESLTKAQEAIQKKYKIFWDLKLGLFETINSPLSNQQQFLTLKLAIDHFNKIVWEKYAANSCGVSLYRGSANFTDTFKWGDKELQNFKEYQNRQSDNIIDINMGASSFCQLAAIDYIKLLAEGLPDDAEPFALIDLSGTNSLLEQARWQDTDLADPLRFAFQCSQIPLNHQLAWNGGKSPSGYINNNPLEMIYPPRSLAVWMPSEINSNTEIDALFEKLFLQLNEKGTYYRLIFEERLIVEWEQLDHLIVISKSITPKVKRMLQGFCAAGGTIVYHGELLGLDQEVSWMDFMDAHLQMIKKIQSVN